MKQCQSIIIDGVEYTPSSQKAGQLDGMDYVCIRSYSAGCFCGYLKEESIDGRKVTLMQARRLWYWKGASSLSQLAIEGVSKPEECKFPCEIESIKIMEVCEIIKMTDKAKKSIQGVSIWKS